MSSSDKVGPSTMSCMAKEWEDIVDSKLKWKKIEKMIEYEGWIDKQRENGKRIVLENRHKEEST